MRKAFVALALIAGLLLANPGIASAAPPVKESGTQTSLTLFGGECVSDDGGQLCNNYHLDAWQDTSTNTTNVCLSTETYRITDENYEFISGENGCTETTDALTLSSGLNATLAPTEVTLTAYTCGPNDCTETGSRTVIVSASGTATASPSKSSGKSSYTEGRCKYRSSFTSVQAPITGSVIVDGTALSAEGSAAETSFKVSNSCR